jgi:trimeric autotransporter adhesin
VNVGIGTTAPQYTLHVVDNGSGGISGLSSIVGHSAVYGQNTATSGTGTNGGSFYTSSPDGAAVVGVNEASDSVAAYFGGNVTITGSLSKGSGSFKIDDPLDPANKYLYHSFVESPDMMNVYNGNVRTNQRGLAVVVLPDYFEALNRDFRYQLTVIGQFAQAIVAKEISGNRFTIRTNRPGVKVSWQVTGIRHDAYADAHRIPTEVEKPSQEQGRYLHPELFGAPPEMAVGYYGSPRSGMGAREVVAAIQK